MGTKRESIMKDMVENFFHIFNQFQIIPNLNTPASVNRSQPPFLTSMIRDIYFTPLNPHNPYKTVNGSLSQSVYHLKHKKWLKKAIDLAKKEYELVWIDKDNFYNHSVKGYALARYGDRDIGYAHSSELESGWDMTSRFYNRCDHFLPIDLNCYLYKYEKDFAFFAQFFGETEESAMWEEKAAERAKQIQNLMWDKDEKFFYDYGHHYQRISHYFSLASYTPLWAGIATPEQAASLVKRLPLFESPYGLMIGAEESLPKPIDLSNIQQRYHDAINDIIKRKQWDYPNIWSPLEYLTVVGLLRYGYIEDAKRIMQKSIKAHAAVYRKYHTFFEKLDGETGEKGKGALYGDQEGFGWTNAIFYRYIHLLDAMENGINLYEEPKKAEPPYNLAIIH
jgi:alpha,alpha-trehalase